MLALADAIAVNQGHGGPLQFRFHTIAARISRRFGRQAASAYVAAVARFTSTIDNRALRSALASKDLGQIEASLRLSGFGQSMRDLEAPLTRASRATGTASAQLLEESGFLMQFNAAHPNVILFARDQAAELVVSITADAREAIRTVVALGAQQGLTIVQQAQAIREVIGLPSNWVQAPLTLRDEIVRGDIAAATGRRLSAVDKQQIRSRIRRGTVSEAFVAKMEANYTRSLINRRALNIARFETLQAANFGQQESWLQAIQQRVLPRDSRRFWIVTQDDRLSEEHATIPSLNPNGVGMTEPFVTTEGLFMFPPSRPNCRCGVGLGIAAA